MIRYQVETKHIYTLCKLILSVTCFSMISFDYVSVKCAHWHPNLDVNE